MGDDENLLTPLFNPFYLLPKKRGKKSVFLKVDMHALMIFFSFYFLIPKHTLRSGKKIVWAPSIFSPQSNKGKIRAWKELFVGPT